jgi:glycosyltransferase involved in cell wall biosynthesis
MEDQPQLPAPGKLRQQLGLSSDTGLVLCVARLSPVKGIDKLIRAFAKVRLRHRTHLAIVGWDHGAQRSYEDLVRRLGVADRVSFCGPLYGDDRFQAYVDADVFALTPRVFEETSLAALEAAACGVPTVLTARCEIPGLAQAGGGLVVKDTDDAVARGIESLLGDPRQRRAVGATGRGFVSVHFSPASVAIQHERLFAEMIT